MSFRKRNFFLLTGGADYVISKLGYADFDRPESRPPKDEKQRALNDAVNIVINQYKGSE